MDERDASSLNSSRADEQPPDLPSPVVRGAAGWSFAAATFLDTCHRMAASGGLGSSGQLWTMFATEHHEAAATAADRAGWHLEDLARRAEQLDEPPSMVLVKVRDIASAMASPRQQMIALPQVAASLVQLITSAPEPAPVDWSDAAQRAGSEPPLGVGERTMRVFISSTFRDMSAERDELVKVVFPALRAAAEARGVTLLPVDLRWGVADEEAVLGRVLPYCLAEIERCRPYVIGLLGQRYGHVPGHVDAASLALVPWLANEPDIEEASLTELELRVGILHDPASAREAHIYLRDPVWIDELPPDERDPYLELPTAADAAAHGVFAADARAASRRRRLAALKDQLREALGPGRVVTYCGPRSLGDLVRADLMAALDARYPTNATPDPVAVETSLHEGFARSRAALHVGRGDEIAKLVALLMADSPGTPLLVTGPSGIGKSALLACAIEAASRARPDLPVISHFVGATPASSDPGSLLRRLTAALGHIAGDRHAQDEVAASLDDARRAFIRSLHRAAALGPLALVVDGLDGLDDRAGVLDLSWLPPVLPPAVRLVGSSQPGRAADAWGARGWATHSMEPLAPLDRAALVRTVLGAGGKTLDAGLLERIVAAPGSERPLFLRILCEELRVWGEHETIAARVGRFLEAPNTPALLDLVLERWEEDYERDRPGLVREALVGLWAARQGLAEAELLDLLGAEANPLPRVAWSPLLFAALPFLADRNGLLGFFHNDLRQAVEARYLAAPEQSQAAHRRLAAYFDARPAGPRRIAELPWQFVQTGDWDALAALLGDVAFFEEAWPLDNRDLVDHWRKLRAASPRRASDVYRPLIDSLAREPNALVADHVGFLLEALGEWEAAKALWERFLATARSSGDHHDVARYLNSLAATVVLAGDAAKGMELLAEAEVLLRTQEPCDLLAFVLTTLGTIQCRTGSEAEGLKRLREAVAVARQLGFQDVIASTVNNLAIAYGTTGHVTEAINLLDEAAVLHRQLGRDDFVANDYLNQAILLRQSSELPRTVQMFERAEIEYRRLGDKEHEIVAMFLRAAVVGQDGDPRGAVRVYMEAGRVAASIGDHTNEAMSWDGVGNVLEESGELDLARQSFEEEERLARLHDLRPDLTRALINKAKALSVLGRVDESIATNQECARVAREAGNASTLGRALLNEALLERGRHDLQRASELLAESEAATRGLNDAELHGALLANTSAVLFDSGRLEEALVVVDATEALARATGNMKLLALAFNNRAAVSEGQGDRATARAWLEKATQLRALGMHERLAADMPAPGCDATEAPTGPELADQA